MMRFVLLILGFASCLGQICGAQDRILIAEGDYVAQSEKKDKKVAHWKLSQLPSGDYEVTESFVDNPYVMQIFRFNVQFLPIGYSIAINPVPGQNARPRPDLHSASFSCVYKENEVACDAEYDGKKSRTSVPASQPYTVLLDEGWFADVTWTFTGVVRMMEHAGIKETLVNAYVIKDDPKDYVTGAIILKPDRPTKLALVGEERANVMGKMQTVRRYETRDSADHSILLVTENGLVAAAVLNGTGDSTRFEISNYQQYKPLEFNGH